MKPRHASPPPERLSRCCVAADARCAPAGTSFAILISMLKRRFAKTFVQSVPCYFTSAMLLFFAMVLHSRFSELLRY